MTRLYGYVAALGAVILALLTFGASQRRTGRTNERLKANEQTRTANAAARERIADAIIDDDTADNARRRLHARNSRDQ